MFLDKTFCIGTTEISKDLEITNSGILKYLEDIASIHSNMAGYGLFDIPKTHKTWLALGWQVEIIRRPKYLENIKIVTWCNTYKKIYSIRNFEVYDENEKLIIKASSKWTLINTTNWKIEKITEDIVKAYDEEEKNVFETIEEFKFKENENINFVKEINIDEKSIDFNDHLHNIDYITLADSIIKTKFSNFKIMYKKEIKKDDIIKIYTFSDNEVIIKSEDKKTLHAIIKFY